MHAVYINAVEKSYGDRQILRGCTLRLEGRDRVGLVGANGAGKSTLMRILSGTEEVDDGTVDIAVTVAFLSQEPRLRGETVREAVLEATEWHQQLLDAYQHAIDSEEWEEMSELQQRLDLVGWDLSHNVQSMLDRLGAPPAERQLDGLSGGERRRVALARTLLSGAELLVLDEPTNHLDTATIEWLEAYLAGYHGAVLLVTHDRYMLEAVATKIVEIEDGLCVGYDGSYADYLIARAERQARLQKAESRRLKLISQEAEWASRSPAARSTKQRARLQRLDELREQRSLPKQRELSFDFRTGDRFGSVVLDIQNLVVELGGRRLIDGLSFPVSPKQRIGVLGANGAGKSTLLRAITGELVPLSGEVLRQSRIRIGVLDQQRSGLKESDTVFEAAGGGSDFVEVHGRRVHVAGFLKQFLFPHDMLDQQCSLLSGGERARLLMAKLLLSGSNVLLLDEPTNDLDLLTLRALEEALLGFTGAVIVVTHDRAFLDRVCTQVLQFEDHGQVVAYADRSQAVLAAKRAKAAAEKPVKPTASATAPAPAASTNVAKLSFKERRELEGLPDLIEGYEQEQADIDQQLSLPETYTDGTDIAALRQRREQLDSLIVNAMERWEQLSERDQ